MREREYRARERYRSDLVYYKLVEMLLKVMVEHRIDPNDVHDAVNLAADRRPVGFEMELRLGGVVDD